MKDSYLGVKFYLPIKGINIVHSSGSAFIQFKLKVGRRPARGCLTFGTYSWAGFQVFWAGISNFSTIQLNSEIPRNCIPITAGILNPIGQNLQYNMKKNMINVLITGKYLINGLVLINTSPAN